MDHQRKKVCSCISVLLLASEYLVLLCCVCWPWRKMTMMRFIKRTNTASLHYKPINAGKSCLCTFTQHIPLSTSQFACKNINNDSMCDKWFSKAHPQLCEINTPVQAHQEWQSHTQYNGQSTANTEQSCLSTLSTSNTQNSFGTKKSLTLIFQYNGIEILWIYFIPHHDR